LFDTRKGCRNISCVILAKEHPNSSLGEPLPVLGACSVGINYRCIRRDTVFLTDFFVGGDAFLFLFLEFFAEGWVSFSLGFEGEPFCFSAFFAVFSPPFS
jgi:hypothetical protein